MTLHNEYLTDEELECLIREAENDELIPAPPDLADKIMHVLFEEPEAAREIKRRQKKWEFRQYCLRVMLTVAAAVAVVFWIPYEDVRESLDEYNKAKTEEIYRENLHEKETENFEESEENWEDTGIMQQIFGGKTIFTGENYLNIFVNEKEGE